MAFVYWIRAPHHTDMFSEGYIGITTNGVKIRYNGHKSTAMKGGKLPVHYAIRKYGSSLSVDTILEGDIDYCRLIEEKLRPEQGIAWNVCKGGQDTQKGRKCTPEQIEQNRLRALANVKPSWKTAQGCQKTWMHAEIIEANLAVGNDQMSIARKFDLTKPMIYVVVKRLKTGWSPSADNDWLEHFADRPVIELLIPPPPLDPWDTPHAIKSVWAKADVAFAMGLERGAERAFERANGINCRGGTAVFRKIRSGWNPLLDEAWRLFKENYEKEEQYGSSTAETTAISL